MKKRVISTIAGIIVLTIVMLCKSVYVFNFALTVICLIGIAELYKAFLNKGFHPISLIGFLVSLGVFWMNLKLFSPDTIKMFLIGIPPVLLFISFVWMIFSKGKHTVPDVIVTLFGIGYVPFLLLFLSLTRQLNHGEFFVWYIFGGAWVTDTFAYLIGRKFGKHHYTPISPNKTMEGVIAGIIFCAIFYGGYTYYLTHIGIEGLRVTMMAFVGVLVSFISQIGDLSASAIKRFCEVKDFGKIMPGHGGVLDRFDSIMMISPFVYLFLQWMI